jgi:hypothetical protein
LDCTGPEEEDNKDDSIRSAEGDADAVMGASISDNVTSDEEIEEDDNSELGCNADVTSEADSLDGTGPEEEKDEDDFVNSGDGVVDTAMGAANLVQVGSEEETEIDEDTDTDSSHDGYDLADDDDFNGAIRLPPLIPRRPRRGQDREIQAAALELVGRESGNFFWVWDDETEEDDPTLTWFSSLIESYNHMKGTYLVRYEDGWVVRRGRIWVIGNLIDANECEFGKVKDEYEKLKPTRRRKRL